MIEEVTLEGSTWAELPNKFEAGTPNIAGAIGLGAAMEFLSKVDLDAALKHDQKLGTRVYEVLQESGSNLQLFTTPGDDWVGVVTFYHNAIHPHDLATICAEEGVCLRAGHHCAQPLMKYLNVPATARVSPYLYNDESDIELFLKAYKKAEMLFA